MTEQYIHLVVCDGCQQCTQVLPNGQVVKQQHILQQEDVTKKVKGMMRRTSDKVEMQDVEPKQATP